MLPADAPVAEKIVASDATATGAKGLVATVAVFLTTVFLAEAAVVFFAVAIVLKIIVRRPRPGCQEHRERHLK